MINIKNRDSVAELRQIIKRSRDESQRTRLRTIVAVKEGKTRTAVAQDFAVSRTSIVSWITLYNNGGAGALKLGVGGRPEGNPKWSADIFNDLAKEIDKGGYWSIPKMQEWLASHKKVNIPEQTVWYRMNQLNYSYKSARPHPAEGNRQKQEAFKKGASSRSWNR